MLQADALVYLSDPSKEDPTLNAQSDAGEEDVDATDGPGPGTVSPPSGDRNAPCPPGTSDADTGTKYGPGKVFEFTMRLCRVKNTTVSVTVAANLLNLFNAAAADGVNLGGGGYRTHESQVQARINNHCADIYYAAATTCRPPTARPGRSMHEAGEAIDFTQGGGTLTRGSSGFLWMKYHAAQYGFKNLPSEPWHWSTNGN